MPGQPSSAVSLSSVVMFVSLVAIVLAAHRAQEADVEGGDSRAPASVEKEARLGAFRETPALVHTEKAHGPLSVSLALDNLPAPGDTFTVRGLVSSRKELATGCDFTWSVPAGAEVISGLVKGHIDLVQPSSPVVIELTLRRVTAANVQVHLMAAASNGGVRFADSAQLNTDLPPALSIKRATAAAPKKFQ